MQHSRSNLMPWVVGGAIGVALLVLAVPRKGQKMPPQNPNRTSVQLKTTPLPVSPSPYRTTWVGGAGSDPSLGGDPGWAAFDFPGLGDDYVFEAGARLVERPDRSATLTGTIHRRSDPTHRWTLEMRLRNRVDPGEKLPGEITPNQGLSSGAYTDQGGAVDPASWRYYRHILGRITGVEHFEGAVAYFGKRRKDACQLGTGANNRNGDEGMSCDLMYQVSKPPSNGASLPKGRRKGASMHLDITDSDSMCAGRSWNEPPYKTSPASHAMTLPGIDTEFIFRAGGSFDEHSDGTASIRGLLVREDHPNEGFYLDLQLSDIVTPGDGNHPPPGSPKKELSSAAYADQGGPVKPSTWRYYDTFGGTLVGMGAYAGAEYDVVRRGPAFQIGVGANGKNTNFGGSGWIETVLVSQPTHGPGLPAKVGNGDFNFDFQGDCADCASAAIQDPAVAKHSGGHAFWFPDIGTDFVFVSGGRFSETSQGTARLTGVVARESNPDQGFLVDLQFGGRVSPGANNHPPSGSPKLELQSSSYASNGGPIDPSAWHYYETLDGSLVGIRDYEGAAYALTRRGPAFQVGLGASGKSLEYGGASWLEADLLSQPSSGPLLPTKMSNGDLNVTIEGECTDCIDAAEADPTYGESGGHAFFLFGMTDGFVFIEGGAFVEHPDGTATVQGKIAQPRDLDRRFDVSVTFSDVCYPGGVDHPPVGSPYLALDPSAYSSNGGPVEPSGWHYYRSTQGTLIGEGAFDGAELSLTHFGPAFQVGPGANGKNLAFGASGWQQAEVVSHPNQGPAFPFSKAQSDFNLNLGGGCPICVDRANSDPQWKPGGSTHALWFPGIGTDFVFDPRGRFVEREDGTAQILGLIYRESAPNERFALNFNLGGRIDPGDANHPPSGSPKLELPSGAYTSNGGTIDPSTWRYYGTLSGQLTGLGDFAGAVIQVDRHGPAFQMGPGANGKNLEDGAASWLDLTLVQQPTTGVLLPADPKNGDINVTFGDDCP